MASTKKLLSDQVEDRTGFFQNMNKNSDSFATVLYEGKQF